VSRRAPLLLLDEHPLLFQRAVARAVGSSNRALILQQINYWLGLPGGVDWRGNHWIWQTIATIRDELGGIVDERTVRREISILERMGVLVSMPRGEIDPRCDSRDRTKAYRIDHDALRRLSDAAEAARRRDAISAKRAEDGAA